MKRPVRLLSKAMLGLALVSVFTLFGAHTAYACNYVPFDAQASSALINQGNTTTDIVTNFTDSDKTGTMYFYLYGPFSSPPSIWDCSENNLVATSTATVTPNQSTYTSSPKRLLKTGYYSWVAYYGGDNNNNSAGTECGDSAQTLRVKGLFG